MASSAISVSSHSHHIMDRLDAARALLGVSPNVPPISSIESILSVSRNDPSALPSSTGVANASVVAISDSTSKPAPMYICSSPNINQLRQPDVGALDALAALAIKQQACIQMQDKSLIPSFRKCANNASLPTYTPIISLSTCDERSEDLLVLRRGRPRSISNPEGMEKWDPLSCYPLRSSRRHFVLPTSIIEEELAEANAAMEAEEERRKHILFPRKIQTLKFEDVENLEKDCVTTNTQTFLPPTDDILPSQKVVSEDSQNDEAKISPEEMLRRARSRLLEDLSEGNLNGDKGVLTLPHSLAKYKEVYNKNGRIGIYTPAERAAIIAKFNSKRTRRVWNKKIRYNCRKNLADRRMRVKGRFVKRSTEQQAKKVEQQQSPQSIDNLKTSNDADSVPTNKVNNVTIKESTKGNLGLDEDMPDVNDADAGFVPTEDQPYRRVRRHTIT